MIRNSYWTVRDDWRVWENISRLLAEPDGLELVNERKVFDACSALNRRQPVGFYGNAPSLPILFGLNCIYGDRVSRRIIFVWDA